MTKHLDLFFLESKTQGFRPFLQIHGDPPDDRDALPMVELNKIIAIKTSNIAKCAHSVVGRHFQAR